MTAGRERSAGQASLSVAARDRVSLRAGGQGDGSDRHSSRAYPGVDDRGQGVDSEARRIAREVIERYRSALERL